MISLRGLEPLRLRECKSWKSLLAASQCLNNLKFKTIYNGLSVNIYWFRAMSQTFGSSISRQHNKKYE